MKGCRLTVALVILWRWSAVAATVSTTPAADDGQLMSPVETAPVGEEAGVKQVVLAQRAIADRLVLVPDTCFFSGASGLKLAGPKAPGVARADLNGAKSFSRIEGLKTSAQRVVWPLRLGTKGKATVRIWCETAQSGAKLEVKVGRQTQTIALTAGDGGRPQPVTAEFANLEEGMQELSLAPADERTGFNGAVLRVEISGPALREALLLRARWRPAAVHSHFDSSSLESAHEQSRLWVMEVRPFHGEKGFYAPITTPFGYFGSPYNADGTSGGINFSMWSYGAKESEPPVAQLSHLLALGDPTAAFGRFDGEGHGVKLRDWNPYQGEKVESTVLALRRDSGTTYDTYTGYFLDQATRTWRLYASGRKWIGGKGKNSESLLPGCFVEVPGPPEIERTGHILRAGDFRGWCRDTKGNWHQLDEMRGSGSDAAREETNCLWTTTPDGWFRMGMGGMIHYRYDHALDLHLGPAKTLPDYLAPDRLKELDRLPTEITIAKAERQGKQVILDVDLSSRITGKSRLKAYYGTTDSLSFAERWQHVKDLGEFSPGHQHIILSDAPESGFCRIIAANATGTYVTGESGIWK